MTHYLRRGAAAGAVAGLALALFLLAVGERSISAAIALEEAAAGHATGPDAPFSRPEQLAGGAFGAALYGILLGLVFGVVVAAVRHRLAGPTDWHRSMKVAAVGFVAVVLVTALKYPPNPPAVGDPDTVGRRTALWLLLLAWGALSAWAAWRLARALSERRASVRGPAVAGTFVGLVALAYVILPGSPDDVAAPATLVWQFRTASLGGQALLWLVLGLAFGWLSERASEA